MGIFINAITEIVKVDGQEIDVYDYEDSLEEFMEWAKENCPGQTTVLFSKADGDFYHSKPNMDIVGIAQDLAGLEGLESAKARLAGKVVF